MSPADPTPLAFLHRFARQRSVAERCDLCSTPLAADHDHLVELGRHGLLCACRACTILFDHQGAAKYRRVPQRVERLIDFRLSDNQWAGLGLPVNLAFFLHSTPAKRVIAAYPGPAGTTEAQLPTELWEALSVENPVLLELAPDVEALLVNRVGAAREYYRVGIDECYRLVGILRAHWQGFSGGTAVWEEVGRFFTGLRERSPGGESERPCNP